MKLTKAMRETLRDRFGGMCAYCGVELGPRWHADHVEPVQRKCIYVRGRGFVQTGEMHAPENDRYDNLMPACHRCNIDKHTFTLEEWRERISRLPDVLQRNYSAYRHALRFRRVIESYDPVVFYFETFVSYDQFERSRSHDQDRATPEAAGGGDSGTVDD